MNPLDLKAKIVHIIGESDVAHASLDANNYARKIGSSKTDQYMVSTAVSELARNIFTYAKKGTIYLNLLKDNSKIGIEVVAEDSGPGIQDIEKAMEDNFSTGGTIGVGLPGTKRLMDYFQIDTHCTRGTKVTIRKWIQ